MAFSLCHYEALVNDDVNGFYSPPPAGATLESSIYDNNVWIMRACKEGASNILSTLLRTSVVINIHKAIEVADGHIDTLKVLYATILDMNKAIELATKNGHTSIAKWLQNHQ